MVVLVACPEVCLVVALEASFCVVHLVVLLSGVVVLPSLVVLQVVALKQIYLIQRPRKGGIQTNSEI